MRNDPFVQNEFQDFSAPSRPQNKEPTAQEIQELFDRQENEMKKFRLTEEEKFYKNKMQQSIFYLF